MQHGAPGRFISDNGPPFNSAEFRTFCEFWSIELAPVSPGHTSANGQVERTIQTLKATFLKAEFLIRAITVRGAAHTANDTRNRWSLSRGLGKRQNLEN